MSDPTGQRLRAVPDDDISILSVANKILRSRRVIAGAALLGAVGGLTVALLSKRVYTAESTFLSQATDPSVSGLAAAASQFGIRVPTGSQSWGPPLYVELVHSRPILERIANDTLTVAEMGDRRVPVPLLMDVSVASPPRRLAETIKRLGSVISGSEIKTIEGVRVSAATPWPSVSYALVNEELAGLNRFNLQVRQSQAAAERQFVERQASEAEQALRASEDRLRQFLEANRVIGSPELSLERDRLQRDVTTRQAVYTTLLQSLEEARIREVRDTPVITVIEPPSVPVTPEPRGTLTKLVFGLFVGGLVGLVTGFVTEAIAAARRRPDPESVEFFELARAATPRFLRGNHK